MDEPPELRKKPPNELQITLWGARDLPVMDLRSSDPVVKMSCCHERARSTVKKKSLNPIWNEKFTLRGDAPDGEQYLGGGGGGLAEAPSPLISCHASPSNV